MCSLPSLSHLNISSWVQMKNFKHSSESAVQSKQGRFSPLSDPGEECVIVCVFICPGTRPAVDESCVCGSGGDPCSRASQGRCWEFWAGQRPFAGCLGCPQGEERGVRVGWCAQLMKILLCSYSGEGNQEAVCYEGVRNLMITRDWEKGHAAGGGYQVLVDLKGLSIFQDCYLCVYVCNELTVVTCLFGGQRNEDNYTLRRRMLHLFVCCFLQREGRKVK